MPSTDRQEWRDHFILSRNLVTPGERSELLRRRRSGELVTVTRGVHADSTLWGSLGPDARYRMLVKAVASVRGDGFVFSHHSAAALWRLPRVGQWPVQTHVLAERADGGRSKGLLVRHAVGVPEETVMIDGLAVTTLARTVVELATVSTFGQAVTAADAALRRTANPVVELPRTQVSTHDLERELARIPLRHGSARARKVVAFANGAADRPGESMSRVSIHLAGLPPAGLQVPLAGASGRRYFVDFYWPSCNLIGEFDGEFKYSDPVFLRGRTPQQALLDEKWREDDLRAARHGMSRWGWDKANSPRLLREHLAAAGLRW